MIFGFGRLDVADGLQRPAMVEQVDPLKRGMLDFFEAATWSKAMDDLGLVRPYIVLAKALS